MKVLRMLVIGAGVAVVALGGLAMAGSGSSSRGDHNSVRNQVGGQQGQQGQQNQAAVSDDQSVGNQQGQVSDQQSVGQGRRHNGSHVGGQRSGQSGQNNRRGERRPVAQEDQSQQTQVEVVPQSGQSGQGNQRQGH